MVGGMYWSLITPAYAPRWLIIAIRSMALLTAFFRPTLPAARAAEERPVVVHRQVAERGRRVDEVLARRTLPDAVLLTQLGMSRRRDRPEVGRIRLDVQADRRQRQADVEVDPVHVVRPRALVEAVPQQRDRPLGLPLGDVVRARADHRSGDPVGVDRHVRRDRGEERHRKPREQVRRPLRQPNLQPYGDSTLTPDALVP